MWYAKLRKKKTIIETLGQENILQEEKGKERGEGPLFSSAQTPTIPFHQQGNDM